jgi:hypothetical protein
VRLSCRMRLPLWICLLASASPASAQPRPRHFDEQRLSVTWFPADGERGPWPAVGSVVAAAALDCTATGEGGALPVGCKRAALEAELSGSGSPLGRCYKLHEVTLPARSVRGFAATGGPNGSNRTSTLLLVHYHTHHTDPVTGRCMAKGIDGCMGGVLPVVGHTLVRESTHLVVPWLPELAADPFAPVHGTASWIVPHDEVWPAAPTTAGYDVTAVAAIATGSSAADVRFAAAVDLVTARLVAADAVGAREALDRATGFAVELTGTVFIPPSLAPATSADADVIARGPQPAAARHAMLRAMLGASVFAQAADLQHTSELARDLRSALEPSAGASRSFLRGSDPAVYVPEVLGALTRLVHERWTDPCAGAR